MKLKSSQSMISHKNLLLAVEGLLSAPPALQAAELPLLKKAAESSREFLTTTKTFEYHGELELKYGAAVKLNDIKLDFDDVVRNVVGKRTDIQVEVYLAMVLMAKPKEDKPAAETMPKVPEIVHGEYCE